MSFHLGLAATITLTGLIYSVVLILTPDDLYRPVQRLALVGYWLFAGLALGIAIPTLESIFGDVGVTASLSVAAMATGLALGQMLVAYLRKRVMQGPGIRAYHMVMEEDSDGQPP